VTKIQHSAIAAFIAIAISYAPLATGAQNASPRSDVLVVGGTPAGVAAAIAAARRGETVTLVSASDDLGGVLTGAMMDQWDLNLAPDGVPVQSGIFDEMYARLGDVFTPESAARSLAEMVAQEPRITVRYDETPQDVQTTASGGLKRIEGVSFRAARGALETLSGSFVIDATDFGDVAALAGARYDLGRQDSGLDERMQAVTLMFTLDDVDWHELAASYDAEKFGPGGVLGRRAWGYVDVMRDYRPLFDDIVVRDLNLGRLPDGSVTVNAIDVVGIDGRDAEQSRLARKQSETEATHLLAYLRERLPGFERASVGGFARDLYVRETRHIAGLERVTTGDVWLGRVPGDSIGLSSYPLDLHPVDVTDEPAFAPTRHVYGVPLGALVPLGFANLMLASPAISASHLASGSVRVVPTTVEEGEAAGAASAQALRDRIDFVTLANRASDVATLRRDLAANGAIVGSPRDLVVARAMSRV